MEDGGEKEKKSGKREEENRRGRERREEENSEITGGPRPWLYYTTTLFNTSIHFSLFSSQYFNIQLFLLCYIYVIFILIFISATTRALKLFHCPGPATTRPRHKNNPG